jgi:uncharacterized coiled-coil protein SlyX
MKTTTPPSRNSIKCLPLRRGFILIPLALYCFALSSAVQAVTPAPDGGYPNGNTAEGQNALFRLTTGIKNTAGGYLALFFNTIRRYNTATGSQALYSNTSGYDNTAVGLNALYGNTTGYANTATGIQALTSNTTGIYNTATGDGALYHNTNGFLNTAIGYAALHNTIVGGNTAIGYYALQSNTTGIANTAVGDQALYSYTTGQSNTAVGDEALYHLTTGYGNTALGYSAGGALTTGDDNIDIGNPGVAGESNTMRIGYTLSPGSTGQSRSFIAAIFGVTTGVADAIPVFSDSAGQLGTMSSSRRFKKEIKPMDHTSEAILALKPVTFQYKNDTKGAAQFGLIAEEVAQVDPDLVVRDAQGEIYTVRYEAVNAMLLNEFLKEHRTMQEQGRKEQEQAATITGLKAAVAKQEVTAAQQQKEIRALTASLKEQASQIQKVSAQLELSKSAPQMAGNDR